MEGTAHRWATPGELVAYALPPGFHWLEILAAHLHSGASFMPVDVRLSEREQARLIDLARPSVVVRPDKETILADAAPIDPERAWAVVPTSGTGGAPRLAQLSRAALGAAVAGSLDALDASAYDPWVACLSPAHIGGLLVLLRAAFTGSRVTIFDRFEPGTLLVEAPEGAHVSLVPTMLERLVRGGGDLTRLGTLLIGGAAIERQLREAADALGGRIVTTYGSTESGGGIVYDGRIFEGSQVRIAANRPDEPGEIELRGPTIMDGYRADPGATAVAFTADGWLRTGDVGWLDAAGGLTVRGRADDAIRTGAETVWPDEVEAVLRTHPSVADVAVAGRPDPEWGEHVTAWVVPVNPQDPPALEQLREHCRDDLARFKAPRDLRVVTVLPRTPSGKVRRADLP
ncbi:MAG: class I adenylate-forming enzyme family protein [Actinomycetota bacterium]